jgi:hypothetical protein
MKLNVYLSVIDETVSGVATVAIHDQHTGVTGVVQTFG